MAKNTVFIVYCELFCHKNDPVQALFKRLFYQTRFSFYEIALGGNNKWHLSFFFENQIQLHRLNVDIAP